MQLSLNDLICMPPGEPGREEILKDWNWLMDDLPVLFTAMGDVFVQSDSGEVSFLDTTSGVLSHIADCGDKFQELLTDSDFVQDKFHAETVGLYLKAGKKLNPGKCYSYKKPLALGGDEKIHNLKIRSIEDHIKIMGNLQEKLKDLPEGSDFEWEESG